MPLITVKSSQRPSVGSHGTSGVFSQDPATFARTRESSPDAPPASPLTPVLRNANPVIIGGGDASASRNSHSTNTPQPRSGLPSADPRTHLNQRPSPQLIDQPPPLPFSGEDSSDAIALRAAISSLQFQRVKAQNDLQTLERIKGQAMQRPEEFRRYVLSQANSSGPPRGKTWIAPPDDDSDGNSSVDSDQRKEGSEVPTPQTSTEPSRPGQLYDGGRSDSQQTPISREVPNVSSGEPSHHVFENIPTAQDVVRCPPIEWAKYHILGEPLDKLHSEQQMRPGIGGSSGRENVIAAPYSPFMDQLESTPSSSGEAGSSRRKDSGASAPGHNADEGPSKIFKSTDWKPRQEE